MRKKYGVRYRTVFNKETREMRNVYSPVIYREGRTLFISDGDEILEYSNRKDALESAKETYLKHERKHY